MPSQDFIDKHRAFNNLVIDTTKNYVNQESNSLGNFLKSIIVKSKNLNVIQLGLKKHKKLFLKKDVSNTKKNYIEILKISKDFAKEKLK